MAQVKNMYLCSMYVRKKHNKSGTTSIVVVSKASGKYKEINDKYFKFDVYGAE